MRATTGGTGKRKQRKITTPPRPRADVTTSHDHAVAQRQITRDAQPKATGVTKAQARRYAKTSRGPTHDEAIQMAANAALRRSGVEAHARRTGRRYADSLLGLGIGADPTEILPNIEHNVSKLVPGTRAWREAHRQVPLGVVAGEKPQPDIGIFPFPKGPGGKLAKDLMDAAGVEHDFRVSSGHDPHVSLRETAAKYGVSPRKLKKHVAVKGKKVTERVLSNEEHWKLPQAQRGNVREVPPVAPPEIQASAAKITEGLKDARALRAEQEQLRRVERGKRSGAAETAMQQEGGHAGLRAGLHELKGELPKLEFAALRGKFGQKEVDDLFTHIWQQEDLRPFEKVNTGKALEKALGGGGVPTGRDQQLLIKVFGPTFVQEIHDSASMLSRVKEAGLQIANIPRSLLASFDVSAPFRQALIAGARHPVMFAKNFKPMLHAFGSEDFYHEILQEIYSRPSYELMQRAKLSLTELGETMAGREEQFPSGYAERIPIAGIGVKASGRAYTGFLDKMRADMFDYLIDSAKAAGRNPEEDQSLLEGIGNLVNVSTGRGDLGRFQPAATLLNTVFFSPRLLASRVNMLNPFWYLKQDPFVRKEAMRSMMQLVGSVGAMLFLADMAGAKVHMDPRNADWAKIKIGNTRIDLLGGFQQPVRLLSQVLSGTVISSTTGDPLTLGPGFGHLNREDIVKRFFQGKLAPPASFVDDWAKGTDFQDQPFSVKRAIIQRVIPLMLQDANDLRKDRGSLPLAAAGYVVGSFGIGMQTYGGADDKKITAFQADMKKAHLKPNPKAEEDLKWKVRLDRETRNVGTDDPEKWRKRFVIAAKLHDERFGTKFAQSPVADEATAHSLYEDVRHRLYPTYAIYEHYLDHQNEVAVSP